MKSDLTPVSSILVILHETIFSILRDSLLFLLLLANFFCFLPPISRKESRSINQLPNKPELLLNLDNKLNALNAISGSHQNAD